MNATGSVDMAVASQPEADPFTIPAVVEAISSHFEGNLT